MAAYAVLETGIFMCGGRVDGRISAHTLIYNPIANVADQLPDVLQRR
jgi:hypothetical protein